MEADRWQQVKAILEEALETVPEDRAAFLQERCAGDGKLRDEVESFLGSDALAGGFLELSPIDAIVRKTEEGDLPEGRYVGPYRIRERLGEGGMGEVYVAEQEKPIRRQVALKIVKLGMDTRRVVARFESERQALALMNHPNIARVLDAGATEQGRPYFVMEHVRGVPITEYCDTHRLSIQERLELFLQVCNGVQHAHQKGIIHRDIKPSNVLVTIIGEKPVPKIIDFGVAKATGHRLTEASVYTEVGQLIGTPEYMSPEQAEMTGLDIDTRTDLYSLGALLYELLTGVTPFAGKDLRHSGLDEIRRKIREEDPPSPSSRVAAEGVEAAVAARSRRTDPATLERQLRGDLNWIIMKALEKDRTRRYSSVSDLAADIARHLQHEPVVAGPASAAYRVSKFVRRHRVGVIAGTVAAVAMTLGAAGITVGLVQATRAERLARQEAERANQEAETAHQVSDFLVDLFAVSDPDEARGRTITAREILDQGAEKISQQLNDQPLVQARLMATMGRVYEKLGLYEEAESLWRQSLEKRRRLLGESHLEVAESADQAGVLARRRGKYEEAELLHRRALAIQEEILGPSDPLVGKSVNTLSIVLAIQGKYDEAEPLFRRALAITEKNLGPDDPEVAHSLTNLANLYAIQGKLELADPLFHRALEITERALGKDHPLVAERLHNVATLRSDQGRYQEAEELFQRTLAIHRKVLPGNHPTLAHTLQGLGKVHMLQGGHAEAEPLFRQALEIFEENLGPDHPAVAENLHSLANLCRAAGRDDEAEALYERALAIREKALGEDHPAVASTLEDYAAFLRGADRGREAAKLEARIRTAQGDGG